MNINPFLALLALALGFLYSWQFVVVKRVTRDVPLAALPDAAGAAPVRAAPVAAAAAAAPATSSSAPSAWAAGADTGWAAAPADADLEPEAAPAASGLARQARDWLGRLDEAKDRLVGAVTGRSTEPEPDETEPDETEPAEPEPAAHPSGLPAWTDAPADGGNPPGYAIKGDKKAQLYLVPDDPDYERARPDIWFVDERAATDAGYAHYVRKPKRTTG